MPYMMGGLAAVFLAVAARIVYLIRRHRRGPDAEE